MWDFFRPAVLHVWGTPPVAHGHGSRLSVAGVRVLQSPPVFIFQNIQSGGSELGFRIPLPGQTHRAFSVNIPIPRRRSANRFVCLRDGPESQELRCIFYFFLPAVAVFLIDAMPQLCFRRVCVCGGEGGYPSTCLFLISFPSEL